MSLPNGPRCCASYHKLDIILGYGSFLGFCLNPMYSAEWKLPTTLKNRAVFRQAGRTSNPCWGLESYRVGDILIQLSTNQEPPTPSIQKFTLSDWMDRGSASVAINLERVSTYGKFPSALLKRVLHILCLWKNDNYAEP